MIVIIVIITIIILLLLLLLLLLCNVSILSCSFIVSESNAMSPLHTLASQSAMGALLELSPWGHLNHLNDLNPRFR